MQIVRGLLTTDNFSFEGEHFQLHDATLRPRPVQQPHPPIWIGAHGEQRMMPIAARYADVWHCFGPPAYLVDKSARISALAEAAGRDPGVDPAGGVALDRGRPRRRRHDGRRMEAAGFDYLVCGWPTEGRPLIEQFAQRILG